MGGELNANSIYSALIGSGKACTPSNLIADAELRLDNGVIQHRVTNTGAYACVSPWKPLGEESCCGSGCWVKSWTKDPWTGSIRGTSLGGVDANGVCSFQ